MCWIGYSLFIGVPVERMSQNVSKYCLLALTQAQSRFSLAPVDNGLFQSQPRPPPLHQLLVQSCLASWTHNPAYSPKSCKLIDWVMVWTVFSHVRNPLLNVSCQLACYPAMVLLFLWKLHRWFSTRIKLFRHYQ